MTDAEYVRAAIEWLRYTDDVGSWRQGYWTGAAFVSLAWATFNPTLRALMHITAAAKDRFNTAVHESGHAMVTLAAGSPWARTVIGAKGYVENGGGAAEAVGGYCVHQAPELYKHSICAAGDAATLLLFGTVQHHHSSDREAVGAFYDIHVNVIKKWLAPHKRTLLVVSWATFVFGSVTIWRGSGRRKLPQYEVVG